MCSLSQLLKIKIAASTAYHLQMDGWTEWVNQEVEQFLRLFVKQYQDDYDKWLSIAEFSHNDRVHVSTCSSPFMLNMGQHPQLGIELLRESCLEILNDFTSRMRKPWTKHIQPSPEQLKTWPCSMIPIIGRHHYMRLEIKYGSMARTSS